jgi:AcrR family transcriptional regulator
MTDPDQTTPEAPPRKMSRETRRQQLIDATIETLALRGLAGTTLSEVARSAGLSHGLVNFHFETKDKLMAETLLYISQEYQQNWLSYLQAAGDDAAHQLDALLRAEFDPRVCSPALSAAWLAFWGEAQGRPLYQAKAGANDVQYIARLEDICARLMAEGGYAGNAVRAARVLRVTSEGVWLDMMTMSEPYDRLEGLATVYACAAAFFPRHFSAEGLLQPR